MKRDGAAVEWAETPPVLLPDEGSKGEEPKAAKAEKPARRKKTA
jgi:hypothetical protein